MSSGIIILLLFIILFYLSDIEKKIDKIEKNTQKTADDVESKINVYWRDM